MTGLDEALATVRVRSSMVGRSQVAPPWSLALDGDEPCVVAAMARGSGWVRHGDGPARPLGEGAVAVACGDRPLVVSDAPDGAPQVLVVDSETCVDTATGESLVDCERSGVRTWGPADAPVSVLLGAYRSDGHLFAHLTADLPSLLVVGGDPLVAAALSALAAETAVDRVGQQVVVDRLMELLLVATVRAWAAAPADGGASWLRALDDPVVGPALRALHAEPARPWTVASLAAEAAVSRSAFARRFREQVGEPPLAHVARWRMARAADLLLDPDLDLAAVAARVGYADAFSLSTAFRRVRGVSPRQHRRAAGRAAAQPWSSTGAGSPVAAASRASAVTSVAPSSAASAT